MNLADKIKTRRKELGISQEVLSKKCGFKHQSRIAAYETGRKLPTLKAIPTLEKALEVYPGWLLENEDDRMAVESTSDSVIIGGQLREIPVRKMPVLTIEELAMLVNGQKVNYELSQGIAVESRLQHCRAIKISGDAMMPVMQSELFFKDGDIVFMDENIEAKPGDFVFALIDDKSTIVFKQYVADSGNLYLRSLNHTYPTLSFDGKKMKIIGVAVEKQTNWRLK